MTSVRNERLAAGLREAEASRSAALEPKGGSAGGFRFRGIHGFGLELKEQTSWRRVGFELESNPPKRLGGSQRLWSQVLKSRHCH